MQLLEKEQLQLRKDQEVEHAQLRKGKEALVRGHLAETEALRAELQEAAKQKDKALREQAERSAGELRTTEQLTLTLTLNLTSTLTPTLPLTLPLTLTMWRLRISSSSRSVHSLRTSGNVHTSAAAAAPAGSAAACAVAVAARRGVATAPR